MIKVLTVFAGLLLASTLASAEAPRWYEVNLLIFTNPSSMADPSERWQDIPFQVAPPGAEHPEQDPAMQNLGPGQIRIAADQPLQQTIMNDFTAPEQADTLMRSMFTPATASISGPQLAFQSLPPQYQYLKDTVSRLKRDGRYRVLFHQSWMQPMLSRRNADIIHISAGKNFGAVHELEGTLKIYINKYLNVVPDLQLISADRTDTPFSGGQLMSSGGHSETAQDSYNGLNLFGNIRFRDTATMVTPEGDFYQVRAAIPLKTKKAMRSKELHYIDNPAYGILIYFVPIKDFRPEQP